MAIKVINIGSYPDDPSADSARSALEKANDNFKDLDDKASLLQGEIDDLEASQQAGTIGYEDKATMDADTGQTTGTIALVTNDATASNNGYYRWDGSAWVKRDDFYATSLDPADTSEAVVGKAVGEYNSSKKIELLRLQKEFVSGYNNDGFWDTFSPNSYDPFEGDFGFWNATDGDYYAKNIKRGHGNAVRFELKTPASLGIYNIGISSSLESYDTNSVIGLIISDSLDNGFHLRYDGSWHNYPARTDIPADQVNKTFYIEMIFDNGFTVNFYDSEWNEILETASRVDIPAKIINDYDNFFVRSAPNSDGIRIANLQINDFSEKENGLKPFYAGMLSKFLQSTFDENWNQLTTSASPILTFSDEALIEDEGMIAAKFYVDPTDTDTGLLIGYGTGGDRVLVGFEPNNSGNEGFIIFTEDDSFVRHVPTSEISEGWYYFRAIKQGLSYVLEVAEDEKFTKKIFSTNVSSADYDSSNFRMHFKIPSDTDRIGWVKYADKDLSGVSAVRAKASPSKAGRNLFIGKFGGEGNDWCFVRTPTIYNSNGPALPMVILNHGNGWVMDGSVEKANFSSNTQFGVDSQNSGAYLDDTRSDYVEYSSPLIEKLLSEGYVVCGAQNYSNTPYGNKDGRNACTDFYYWMIDNWNVKDRCYMIGASAGGIMTMNAIRQLGIGKVAAVVNIAGLVDLIDHYVGYSPHRAGIESAYGLPSDGAYTKSELLAFEELYTHCPVNHDVVESGGVTIKNFSYPPLYLIASGGDTVVDIDNNSQLLKNLCDASKLICDLEDVDPDGVNGYGHSHWTQYDKGDDIVEFLSTHR